MIPADQLPAHILAELFCAAKRFQEEEVRLDPPHTFDGCRVSMISYVIADRLVAAVLAAHEHLPVDWRKDVS